MEAAGQVIQKPWSNDEAMTSSKTSLSRKLFERPRYNRTLDLPPSQKYPYNYKKRNTAIVNAHKHNVLRRGVFTGNALDDDLIKSVRTHYNHGELTDGMRRELIGRIVVVKPGSSKKYFSAVRNQSTSQAPPCYEDKEQVFIS